MTPGRARAPAGHHLLAWAGGTLFVLALACGVYFFGIVLGREGSQHAAPGGARAIAVDALLFAGFALHHSVMARSRTKRWLARSLLPELERAAFVWVASVLFIALCALWQPVGGVAWQAEGVWRPIGYAVQIVGLVLLGVGARVLDPLELAGIRQIHSRRPAPGASPFSTRGPYGIVRHPIYSGTILALVAAPHMTGDRFLFTALVTVYIVIAIPWEERALATRHGDSYARYRAQVRWRLVPGVF